MEIPIPARKTLPSSILKLHDKIPKGAGLGLRPSLWHMILEHADQIDFVELIIDDYLDVPIRDAVRILKPMTECLPVIAHGVSLSVASAHGVDLSYVERVARLLDALGIEIYSEHLSFRKAHTGELGQFVPVPFTEAWAARTAANVRKVQEMTGRTILLENITYLLGHPKEGIGEAGFVRAVLEEADCGLLLDVTNVLINGANLGYEPTQLIDALPTERIIQAHIAGGHVDGRIYVDSHGHAIADASFELLSDVCEKSLLGTALLERDKHFPPTEELMNELGRVRRSLKGKCRKEGAEQNEKLLFLPPLRTREEPTQPIPDADSFVPESYQSKLVETFLKWGRLRALRKEYLLDSSLVKDPISSYLLSFPVEDSKAFTKVLHFKRRENITGLLHGLCHHLGDDLPELLASFFQKVPEQGRQRLDDAIDFATFMIDSLPQPSPLRALAIHECTTLSMRAIPFRFWHPLTSRKVLFLSCDPCELDQAIHGKLPSLLPAPVRVRYIRKRRGIWVEKLT